MSNHAISMTGDIKVDEEFLTEVLTGLSQPQKSLPCRYLYDAQGSHLFEQITTLPEYYPTRTETHLLAQFGTEIADTVPKNGVVIEFGSGSSVKTELLLQALRCPGAYIPIDISADAVFPAARRIASRFPTLAVHPVLGSFIDCETLQLPAHAGNRIGFFPGSTIGNLTHSEATAFLKSARLLLGPEAVFLVGVDLQKPVQTLLAAYNDSEGVTARFNLNILARINRELRGTFQLRDFVHEAVFNENEGRVEMHVRARRDQRATVYGRRFDFRKGETIHTENSYKYSIPQFHALARAGGWKPSKVWTDENLLFSLHLLA